MKIVYSAVLAISFIVFSAEICLAKIHTLIEIDAKPKLTSLVPTNVQITATPSGAQLTWTNVIPNLSAKKCGYHVYRAEGKSQPAYRDMFIRQTKKLIKGTIFDDSTVQTNTTYWYVVVGNTPSGVGACEPKSFSTQLPVTVTTTGAPTTTQPPTTPPAVIRPEITQKVPFKVAKPLPGGIPFVMPFKPYNPTNFCAHVNYPDGNVVLTWKAVPDVKYYLLQGPGVPAQKVPASATSYPVYTVRGLGPGKHSYTIKAYYEGETTQDSDDLVDDVNVPQAYTFKGLNPTNFRATKDAQGNVILSWDAMPNAKSYWLGGSGVPHQTVPASAKSYTVRGLGPGTHDYDITTHYDTNCEGDADYASMSKTTIVIQPPPRYRLVMNGFVVKAQTWDHALEWDGKGDEVFIETTTIISDKNGNILHTEEKRTPTMGDTNSYPSRIYAGTAPGRKGGLVTGNEFPSASPWIRTIPYAPTRNFPPYVLWEGDLAEGGDIVTIIPTIWEEDQGNILSLTQGAVQFLKELKDSRGHMIKAGAMLLGGPEAGAVYEATALGVDVLALLTGKDIAGDNATRLIGTEKYGSTFKFNPKVIVLNHQTAARAFTPDLITDFGKGPGIFSMLYKDVGIGDGCYELYFQLERVN